MRISWTISANLITIGGIFLRIWSKPSRRVWSVFSQVEKYISAKANMWKRKYAKKEKCEREIASKVGWNCDCYSVALWECYGVGRFGLLFSVQYTKYPAPISIILTGYLYLFWGKMKEYKADCKISGFVWLWDKSEKVLNVWNKEAHRTLPIHPSVIQIVKFHIIMAIHITGLVLSCSQCVNAELCTCSIFPGIKLFFPSPNS